MSFYEKYTTAEKQKNDPKEAKKEVVTSDTYAICEALQNIASALREYN